MLMPKKVKYRKQQRGRMAGKAWRGSSIAFGDFGLKIAGELLRRGTNGCRTEILHRFMDCWLGLDSNRIGATSKPARCGGPEGSKFC